jgi:hypothetical protein
MISRRPGKRAHDGLMKFFLGGILIFALFAGLYLKWPWIQSTLDEAIYGPRSISERVQQYGTRVATRLRPDFAKAGVDYPPSQITLVILKQERLLGLYAQSPKAAGQPYRFIRSYPILAASGHLGPKLREGDWQVPEGIYAVESLNPNSRYHLALHVDYPNAFDRARAEEDGRTQLGGDIMIHGSYLSVGCVAMGDSAAEDLFVLAAQSGLPHVRLLFCPFDFRQTKKALAEPDLPAWAPKLYADLEKALYALPLPTPVPEKTP